jgi:serine/threonine-protein kinase RsbW
MSEVTTTRPTGPDVVEIMVPADGAFVSVLRSVTAGLASRCDLTLDEIEDLRIAIDEASALLLPHALPGSSITVRFTLAKGSLAIYAAVPASESADPDQSSFAWTVLDALASTVSVAHTGSELAISLTKRRGDLPQ